MGLDGGGGVGCGVWGGGCGGGVGGGGGGCGGGGGGGGVTWGGPSNPTSLWRLDVRNLDDCGGLWRRTASPYRSYNRPARNVYDGRLWVELLRETDGSDGTNYKTEKGGHLYTIMLLASCQYTTER